ncbi:MAG TPA: hypothetical protein VJW76_04870 [Verrucomicrobiae bacterium]|nr:hypothetical protein [Verrucomicrobiae bacterium]
MRRFQSLWCTVLAAWLSIGALWAGEFKLANGSVIRGELASADDDGIVVKLDVGGFSKREAWINFSQETLKELAKDPKIAPLVEPFIELDPEEIKQQDKAKEIVVKDVPNRLERPDPKPGLLGAFVSPLGLTIVVVLLLANVYAGYEVALYRQQPIPLVCGISVVLPVLGPLIFLCLPTRAPHTEEAAAPAPPEPVSPLGAGKRTTANVPGAPVPSAGSLSLAAAKGDGGEGITVPQTFNRGEFTFNRRFFETKFPGFFRIVPSEAEKDLVLAIKAVRNEYVCKRISRISSNEMHVQVLNGGEVQVTFAEITSITIRHKDAKA